LIARAFDRGAPSQPFFPFIRRSFVSNVAYLPSLEDIVISFFFDYSSLLADIEALSPLSFLPPSEDVRMEPPLPPPSTSFLIPSSKRFRTSHSFPNGEESPFPPLSPLLFPFPFAKSAGGRPRRIFWPRAQRKFSPLFSPPQRIRPTLLSLRLNGNPLPFFFLKDRMEAELGEDKLPFFFLSPGEMTPFFFFL